MHADMRHSIKCESNYKCYCLQYGVWNMCPKIKHLCVYNQIWVIVIVFWICRPLIFMRPVFMRVYNLLSDESKCVKFERPKLFLANLVCVFRCWYFPLIFLMSNVITIIKMNLYSMGIINPFYSTLLRVIGFQYK